MTIEFAPALVRALFYGLPDQEYRMAIFQSASDESSGPNKRSRFFHAGFIAPERDWSEFFTPAWKERVLDGNPNICSLHMTDIKNPSWRKTHGITEVEAERRVDEAINIIDTMGSLFPIGSHIDEAFLMDTLAPGLRIFTSPQRRAPRFAADHICFLWYVFVVLNHAFLRNSEIDRVDFMVEEKDEVSPEINALFDAMPEMLEDLGSPELIPLLGKLIPARKDLLPVQAADVLCWFTRRAEARLLTPRESRQFSKIASRPGCLDGWTEDDIKELVENLRK